MLTPHATTTEVPLEDWIVPPEVMDYAAAKGIAAYLPTVLEMTRRSFPTARRCAVYLEGDPQIAQLKYLVIAVEVPLDAGQARSAQRRWQYDLLGICPAPLAMELGLRIQTVA